MGAEEDRHQVGTPQEARREVDRLVRLFDCNRDVYTRPDYKETRVRVESIDPFFEASGCDVPNVQWYEEHDPQK